MAKEQDSSKEESLAFFDEKYQRVQNERKKGARKQAAPVFVKKQLWKTCGKVIFKRRVSSPASSNETCAD